MAPEMNLISALCSTTHAMDQAESIAKDLVEVHVENGRVQQLLDKTIQVEVERTSTCLSLPLHAFFSPYSRYCLLTSSTLVRPTSLFRDNTMTSFLISAYTRLAGTAYLKLVLKGLLKCTTIHAAETLEVFSDLKR